MKKPIHSVERHATAAAAQGKTTGTTQHLSDIFLYASIFLDKKVRPVKGTFEANLQNNNIFAPGIESRFAPGIESSSADQEPKALPIRQTTFGVFNTNDFRTRSIARTVQNLDRIWLSKNNVECSKNNNNQAAKTKKRARFVIRALVRATPGATFQSNVLPTRRRQRGWNIGHLWQLPFVVVVLRPYQNLIPQFWADKPQRPGYTYRSQNTEKREQRIFVDKKKRRKEGEHFFRHISQT